MAWRKNSSITFAASAGDNFAAIFDSVADFRSSSGIPTETVTVTIRGYDSANALGGSSFLIDRSDTNTSDNGVDVFVNTDGLRIKRFNYSEINLFDCGAKGLGVSSSTEDQSALNRALQLAFSANTYTTNVTIRIPSGVFRLSGNSILTANTYGGSTGRRYVQFIGEGSNTVLEIAPVDDSTPSWLYNNDPNKDFIYALFRDFIIRGTNSSLSNGFKLNPTSTAPSQGFSFDNIFFESLAVALETTGTILGSETTGVDCTFRGCGKCLVLNNEQSVNHRFYGCDFELFDESLIEVGSGGGGNLNIHDASIIPINGAKIFDITRSANLGRNNGLFTFSGIRSELRDDSIIGTIDGTNQDGSAVVIIENSMFTDDNDSTNRSVLVTDANGVVAIKDSTLSSANFGLEVTTASNSGFTWHGGLIELIRCQVNQSLPHNTTLPSSGNFSAHVKLRDCIPIGGNPVANRRDHYAMDADLGVFNSGNGGNLKLDIKRCQLFNPTAGWPTNTGYGEHVLYLPPGVRITKFYVWRPGGTNTSAYSLIIGSDDKATTYLETNSVTGNTDHVGEVSYSIHNAIAVSDNKLRLWCNGTPGAVLSRGGVAYIEYI